MEATKTTPETTPNISNAPPTAFDRLRRRLLVGPDDPAARSVWRVSQVYWLVVVYSGVWIGLRSRGVGGEPLAPGTVPLLVLLFSLGTVHLFVRSHLAVRRGGYGTGHASRVGWLHTLVDLVLVAAVVRITGGAASALFLLFFVIVVAESVLESVREARWVRFGVTIALFAAMVPVPLRGGAWVLEFGTRLLFLLAVSLVAQRLRINAERERSETASLRAEMALLNERSALSREIHDGVGNALAAAVLRLEVTARVLAKSSDADVPALLREEAQVLRGAMNEVRDWTFFHKPWGADGDAGARLVSEVERLSRRTGLSMRVLGAATLGDLPTGTARLAVLRIAQEALTNAAKYATDATEVIASLERHGDFLTLTIRDNGAGFDPQTSPPGVGMSSMRDRAAGLGGTLSVDSTPGQGTTVTAQVPLS